MKVIVTGADGFLGTAVVRALDRQAGVATVALGRRETGIAGSAGRVRADLADPADLLRTLRAVAPQAIVNCAAQIGWGDVALGGLYPVNAVAPAVLGQWCAESSSALHQISGTLVYGVRATRVDASTPINADTAYGRSKLLGDEMILASGCRASILRIGGIFGAEGPDHLGLNRAIRSALAGTAPVLIGQGTARRNYVHVEDTAEAIAHAVKMELTGVHLLGGRETLSIGEMLQAVCDVLLPGSAPLRQEGPEAADQVVVTSPSLPVGATFRDALRREA